MIIIGRTEAKAIENNFFVGQERVLGDQNRLETDVVLAVNDAFQRIFLKGCLSIVIFFSNFERRIFYNNFFKNYYKDRQNTPFFSKFFCLIFN